MSSRQSHKQLSLELGSPPPSTFENFFVAANREPVQRLRELPVALAREQANDRLIYLWGEVGSGRTHLLHAVCDAALHLGLNCRYLSPHHALSDFIFDPSCQVYTVDDVELKRLVPLRTQLVLFDACLVFRAIPRHHAVAVARPQNVYFRQVAGVDNADLKARRRMRPAR